MAALACAWTLLSCAPRQAQVDAPTPDEAIAAEVRHRLQRADLLDPSAIRVQVSAGVVELSGVVTSAREAREALRQAGLADGARQVVNRLVIVERTATGTSATAGSAAPA